MGRPRAPRTPHVDKLRLFAGVSGDIHPHEIPKSSNCFRRRDDGATRQTVRFLQDVADAEDREGARSQRRGVGEPRFGPRHRRQGRSTEGDARILILNDGVLGKPFEVRLPFREKKPEAARTREFAGFVPCSFWKTVRVVATPHRRKTASYRVLRATVDCCLCRRAAVENASRLWRTIMFTLR